MWLLPHANPELSNTVRVEWIGSPSEGTLPFGRKPTETAAPAAVLSPKDQPQYFGTEGSISSAQAEIPPLTLFTYL